MAIEVQPLQGYSIELNIIYMFSQVAMLQVAMLQVAMLQVAMLQVAEEID